MDYIRFISQLIYDYHLLGEQIQKNLIAAIEQLDSTTIPEPIGVKVYLKDHPMYPSDMRIICRVSDNVQIGLFGVKSSGRHTHSCFIRIHKVQRTTIAVDDPAILLDEIKKLADYFCIKISNIENLPNKILC